MINRADFFRKSEQEDIRHVSERYIAKSDPFIVMVSTPYAPDGLFESIEKEPEETCIYKRIFMDYTYGLDKIYTRNEIDKAKISPSFEREYNLKYLGLIGNVFHTKDIDAAIEKGKLYDPEFPNIFARKSMGIDPGFGSSPFGICITQFVNSNEIQILYADEFERPDYNVMLSKVRELVQKYDANKILIDGANPEFIRSLKIQLSENPDYDKVIARYKDKKINWQSFAMKVIPINFRQEHKAMLSYCKMLLEDGYISISPVFSKLVTSLRTAIEDNGILDQETTSYNDIFDAFRLALRYYRINQGEKREESALVQ